MSTIKSTYSVTQLCICTKIYQLIFVKHDLIQFRDRERNRSEFLPHSSVVSHQMRIIVDEMRLFFYSDMDMSFVRRVMGKIL